MLAETINGVEILVDEDVIHRAIEEYLNTHMFKEPVKVSNIKKQSYYDRSNDFQEGYKVQLLTLLERLGKDGSKMPTLH